MDIKQFKDLKLTFIFENCEAIKLPGTCLTALAFDVTSAVYFGNLNSPEFGAKDVFISINTKKIKNKSIVEELTKRKDLSCIQVEDKKNKMEISVPNTNFPNYYDNPYQVNVFKNDTLFIFVWKHTSCKLIKEFLKAYLSKEGIRWAWIEIKSWVVNFFKEDGNW